MTDVSGLEQKLDLLIALARVGLRDQLSRDRRELEADAVSAAILRLSTDWTAAGALKDAVGTQTRQSEPTIKRRIAELVGRGALVRQGAGRSVSYRNSGLFEL